MTRERDNLLTREEAEQYAAITVRQARHLLYDMGKNAFYRAVATGAVPSLRINGKILIPVVPFLEMIDKGGRP